LTSLRAEGSGAEVLRFHLQETTGTKSGDGVSLKFLGSEFVHIVLLEPFEVAEYRYYVQTGELKYAW
ncbi:MAG: hypothetical protein KAH21_02265, partial [Spirochaetaceae bacterium]|nr:hypothetical protein [Spirochaetaceae bacterium]